MADGGGVSVLDERLRKRASHRVHRLGWDATRAAATPSLGRGRPKVSDGLVDEVTRYSDDREAKRFVRTFPDGASREDIGVAFGFSKENVRLIEQAALRKLIERLALVGITRDDIASILATRRGRYEDGADDGMTVKCDGEGPRGAMDRRSSERVGSGPQSARVLRLFSILAASRRHAKRANAIAERLGYTTRDA